MVTHNQDEAMLMADRIAVMNHGKVEQYGSAQDIYRAPATPFVAEFVGQGNWLPFERGADGLARVGGLSLRLHGERANASRGRLFCRPRRSASTRWRSRTTCSAPGSARSPSSATAAACASNSTNCPATRCSPNWPLSKCHAWAAPTYGCRCRRRTCRYSPEMEAVVKLEPSLAAGTLRSDLGDRLFIVGGKFLLWPC